MTASLLLAQNRARGARAPRKDQGAPLPHSPGQKGARMPSWAVLAADNKKPTPKRGGSLVGGTSAAPRVVEHRPV